MIKTSRKNLTKVAKKGDLQKNDEFEKDFRRSQTDTKSLKKLDNKKRLN